MNKKKSPYTFKIACTDDCGTVLGTQTIELTSEEAKAHDTRSLGSLCDDCAAKRRAERAADPLEKLRSLTPEAFAAYIKDVVDAKIKEKFG